MIIEFYYERLEQTDNLEDVINQDNIKMDL